ncbi:type II toxin-antitoxin system VapC family toxin [Fodinicola feengrottensis]|uniref:Type II toxin-antitoxin system VapC family toxin n=1 Tax=Fodinicola feengrottensis TaxID=435914 RepID=A0ABN2FP70_9ACTN
MITYLDASAILRLIIPHEWTEHLNAHLRRQPQLGTSVIGMVETQRTLMRGATEEQMAWGDRLLREFQEIAVTDEVARTASAIPSRSLRTLDALHVASAIVAGASQLVTYDKTMAAAARAVGLRVVSPGVN